MLLGKSSSEMTLRALVPRVLLKATLLSCCRLRGVSEEGKSKHQMFGICRSSRPVKGTVSSSENTYFRRTRGRGRRESPRWCSGLASCSGCLERKRSPRTPQAALSDRCSWFQRRGEGPSRGAWKRSRLLLGEIRKSHCSWMRHLRLCAGRTELSRSGHANLTFPHFLVI